MYTVKKLLPAEVLKHWSLLEPEIIKAMDHGAAESDPFDLAQKGINNQAEFWIVFDKDNNPVNVTVTEILEYAQQRTLHIITTTGKGWKSYKESHHVLEDYARSIGCIRIEAWCREGWERLLPKLTGKHGEKYEHTYSVMSMKLMENS